MALRAPLESAVLKALRPRLHDLLPILEKRSGWYGSIYVESKVSRTLSADFKQTRVSENAVLGGVVRIFDGATLYEQGTDDLSWESLHQAATALAARVAVAPKTGNVTPYQPPTWAQRLSARLDREIVEQVPSGVTARTPVHFGIRYREDPRAVSSEAVLSELKSVIEALRADTVKHGMKPEDVSFASARQGLSIEDSLFVDRESDLSQTLYRVNRVVLAMSGPERVVCVEGGLGGLETVRVPDTEIQKLLADLAGLRKAERLKPGRYRVIFAPPLTGVLAHEAFGHSQEADTCARGRSKAWDLQRSGEIVGNDQATILNNPAIYRNGDQDWAAWGSYFFDEEGWLAQEQVLLDKGRLLAPMTDLKSAVRLGIQRSANGKRETWAHGVYTRQTNTYFSAGDQTYEQMLAQIDDGFVAVHAAGGMEDPKGMGIQVGISYLEEVKKGKLTGRIFRGPAGGDIQLTGYTPDVLKSIVAKSKPIGEHPRQDVGGCGKYHKEFVYAGCGGPYLLLGNVILG